MPTFRPPLFHTSEVIANDPSSTPFVRLTFSVSLDNDEGVDGVYQLWTDLPNLNDKGEPLFSAGEWHEINFIALPTPDSGSSSSSGGITLQPISVSPESTEASQRLYAIIHIPSNPAFYSYTLRHAKSSGEIVWLGSDGSNGTVNIKQGETSKEVVIEAGPWDGLVADMEDVKWNGVAIVMDHHDRSVKPVHLDRTKLTT
jgi:hypothetical protein